MEIEFNNVSELYQRLKPALNSKVSELSREGYKYLTSEDVWNYLKEIKWKKSRNLSLNEMVSDIFNSDCESIDTYFKESMRPKKRKVYLEEE